MKEGEAKKMGIAEEKSVCSQTTSFCYLTLFLNSDNGAAFFTHANRNSSSSVQHSG